MNRLILGLTLLVSVLFLAIRVNPSEQSGSSAFTGPDEKLVVFTQAGDEHFLQSSLPLLREWAKAEGLELLEVSSENGVPAEITGTPAIVFQNKNGRAIYASRYAELGTIKNFVRTNRLRPQATEPFCTSTVLQYRSGRAALNAPIKLTALQGSIPKNWSSDSFRELAFQAIKQGMDAFEQQEEACLQRTDRAFYCDFHPYLSADGTLYLSLELYSMFNCIRPVFSTREQPLQASYTNADVLFAEAGQRLQQEIMTQIAASEIGDAWSPLADDVTAASWEDLGLALAEGSASAKPMRTDFTVANNWSGANPIVADVPALFFRFMEPLDRYAGEVPEFTGELQMDETGSLRSGTFTARLKSLTMGMAELDDKVKRKYIYTRRFPEASFSFDIPEQTGAAPLQAGRLNRVPVSGTFTFMKQEQPLLVQAELTPELLDSGEQQLLVHVQFDLNVTDDYGIAGPDGPDPARKTMIFDLNFIMSPQ